MSLPYAKSCITYDVGTPPCQRWGSSPPGRRSSSATGELQRDIFGAYLASKPAWDRGCRTSSDLLSILRNPTGPAPKPVPDFRLTPTPEGCRLVESTPGGLNRTPGEPTKDVHLDTTPSRVVESGSHVGKTAAGSSMDTRALRARRTLVEGTHDVMNRQAREANGEFGAGDGTPSGGGPASPTAVRSDLAADGITAPGASNSATTHDGQVVQTSAKNGASVKTIGGDTEVHATGPVRDAVEKSLTKNGYTFNAYAPGKYVVTK